FTGHDLAWEGRRVHTCHFFHHADHLAAVTELVVVPNVQDNAVVVADGGFGIDHTGVAGADEVGGHHFLGGDVIDLLVQIRMHGRLAQVFVDLVAGGGLLQVQVQDRHGDV